VYLKVAADIMWCIY